MSNTADTQIKVLMHICCAPCSIYTLKKLREEGMRVSGYFYNPNIHPYTEFIKRLDTLRDYAGNTALPLVIDRTYDLRTFLKGALDYGEERCLFCYRLRLDKAFRKGLEDRADAVTTTLLYSRYQRHDDIRRIGEELSAVHGIPFLYRDFRIGWKEGVIESKAQKMYRQQYCGCIFSEWERYGRTDARTG
ncbi:MAG TPA: epoxyqueuosine reductase QueH [Syntrophorhabdaceae bacterium]|nr:epoxyqueuosine reductase QueH [Syntrophorhabdaceae bacterium]